MLDFDEAPPGLPQIHTTDRSVYRSCRRQWKWSSYLGEGLETNRDEKGYRWFGTGWHFAQQDYHGYQRFQSLEDAFLGYASCFRDHETPDNFDELLLLGKSMTRYYEKLWLPRRDIYETLWIDGEPQVEVEWEIPLPTAVPSVYHGTFDRVAVDPFGRYWIMEYKSFARFESFLDNNSQITSYCWGAHQLYGLDFEGLIFEQALKKMAEKPEPLKRGGFSKNKQLPMSYASYYETLMEEYGEIPQQYYEHLNWLAAQETPDGDMYVRRDALRRNAHAIAKEGEKIVSEASEMLDPCLPIYPNPGRQCGMCDFRDACVTLDDGGDYRAILELDFRKREEKHQWRIRLEQLLESLPPRKLGPNLYALR